MAPRPEEDLRELPRPDRTPTPRAGPQPASVAEANTQAGMTPTLNPVLHELISWTHALGPFSLRDRLSCPECKRIGTWKPHGSWYDTRHGDLRATRRWLCKWCGFYVGPEGTLYAFPSSVAGCWVLPGWTDAAGETPGEEPLPVEKVPSAKLLEAYGRVVNPWAG